MIRSDNFDRPDGPLGGSTPSDGGSPWFASFAPDGFQIASGETGYPYGGNNFYAVLDAAATDVDLSVDVTRDAGDQADIFLRGTGHGTFTPTQCINIRLYPTNVIVLNPNGAGDVSTPIPAASQLAARWRFLVRGNKLTVYATPPGGTEAWIVGPITVSVLTGTEYGFASSFAPGLRYDNLAIDTPVFDLGVNFRATSDFVTEAANEVYSLGEPYPTLRGGTFGWTTNQTGWARDRSASNDRRLAGIVLALAGGTSTFRLDLPGPGAYAVHLAMGDPLYNGGNTPGYNSKVEVLDSDGTTPLFTVAPSSPLSPQQFYDAAGASLTNLTWPTLEQGVAVTVSGSAIFFRVGDTASPGGFTPLAHVRVVAESAPAPPPPFFRRTLYRRAGSRGVLF